MGPLSISPDRGIASERGAIGNPREIQTETERKKPELESHMGLHFLNAFCISFDSIRNLNENL